MSNEWIEANIEKAVSRGVATDILAAGSRLYSRHLFFSPAYHPSGSPLAHMQAKLNDLPAGQHARHDAFHYDENDVRAAVNRRKSSLRKKYGDLPSLRTEQ
jgi:hypothetical protein